MNTKNKKRRSDIKKMTKEAVTLKYMRESRGLSIRKAAKKIGVSDSRINHAENGRMDLKPDFVLKVVQGYGYSYQEFLDYLTGRKESPEHMMTECIEMIKRLDKSKLRAVRAILENF